jgi:endothelin-converting enzyme
MIDPAVCHSTTNIFYLVLILQDVKKYYENVTVTHSYFKNAITFAKYQTKSTWNTLLDGDTWGLSRMSVPAATAFYSLVINTIVIPAGIMQLPIFSSDLPEYVSYGGLGSVIGHELSHGIDAGSTKVDEAGTTGRWWDSFTTKNYEDRTKCFVQQYSNFTFTDQKGKITHVNGELTQAENIADAGGLSASFAAWRKRDKARPNQLLPGLEEFTKEQLFFLSYASLWCAKVGPEQVALENMIDNHSPRDKRILGTLANSRGFREAFQCKNKEPTCELW